MPESPYFFSSYPQDSQVDLPELTPEEEQIWEHFYLMPTNADSLDLDRFFETQDTIEGRGKSAPINADSFDLDRFFETQDTIEGRGKCPADTGRFICPIEDCPKNYLRKGDLKIHIVAKHGKEFLRPDMKSRSTKEGKSFICPFEFCPSGFGRRADLSRHLVNKHSITLEKEDEEIKTNPLTLQPEQTFISLPLERSGPLSEERNILRNSFSFQQESQFDLPMQEVVEPPTEEKHIVEKRSKKTQELFTCHVINCGKSYLRKGDLKKHIFSKHGP